MVLFSRALAIFIFLLTETRKINTRLKQRNAHNLISHRAISFPFRIAASISGLRANIHNVHLDRENSVGCNNKKKKKIVRSSFFSSS